jgi:hypothetical protein
MLRFHWKSHKDMIINRDERGCNECGSVKSIKNREYLTEFEAKFEKSLKTE